MYKHFWENCLHRLLALNKLPSKEKYLCTDINVKIFEENRHHNLQILSMAKESFECKCLKKE